MATIFLNHAIDVKGRDPTFWIDLGITYSCKSVLQRDFVESNTSSVMNLIEVIFAAKKTFPRIPNRGSCLVWHPPWKSVNSSHKFLQPPPSRTSFLPSHMVMNSAQPSPSKHYSKILSLNTCTYIDTPLTHAHSIFNFSDGHVFHSPRFSLLHQNSTIVSEFKPTPDVLILAPFLDNPSYPISNHKPSTPQSPTICLAHL